MEKIILISDLQTQAKKIVESVKKLVIPYSERQTSSLFGQL